MAMLRIACRTSKLAQIQANIIGKQLGLDYELVLCSTAGDRNQDQALAQLGGKGLFVKEVEQALLDNRADIAVHSLKDMPVLQPPELPIAAYSARAPANDVFIGVNSFDDLPLGAKVGTCSPRRKFQLHLLRPDLEFVLLRGNINTRIAKLENSDMSAIILAEAGVVRANDNFKYARFTIDQMLPAAGQGILAVQLRPNLQLDLSGVNCVSAEQAAKAERSIVKYLSANCHSPLAVYAEQLSNKFRLQVKAGNNIASIAIDNTANSYDEAIALTIKDLAASDIKKIINS